MANPLNLIEQGIYNALTANSSLMALATGVYITQAPPGINGNWVIFQYSHGGDENMNLRRSADATFRVEAISKLHATAVTMSGYIDDVFNGTISVSGWTVWRVEMNQFFNRVQDIDGVMWYRVGGMYRISIDYGT
jgi:hypothetical protein